MAGLVIANLVLRGIWLTVMHPPQQFDFLWYYNHGWCRQVWPRLAASRIVQRIRRMRKATGTSKAAPPPV
jgi:hypothetical protein